MSTEISVRFGPHCKHRLQEDEEEEVGPPPAWVNFQGGSGFLQPEYPPACLPAWLGAVLLGGSDLMASEVTTQRVGGWWWWWAPPRTGTNTNANTPTHSTVFGMRCSRGRKRGREGGSEGPSEERSL
eukprot:GHVU01222177.1.p2 GENE.GHVU01222177.1~~GHVU01222177.1.p2  ORF type:complete len:142 (-),score=12.24 GHVU01222177.1:21-401(-)